MHILLKHIIILSLNLVSTNRKNITLSENIIGTISKSIRYMSVIILFKESKKVNYFLLLYLIDD